MGHTTVQWDSNENPYGHFWTLPLLAPSSPTCCAAKSGRGGLPELFCLNSARPVAWVWVSSPSGCEGTILWCLWPHVYGWSMCFPLLFLICLRTSLDLLTPSWPEAELFSFRLKIFPFSQVLFPLKALPCFIAPCSFLVFISKIVKFLILAWVLSHFWVIKFCFTLSFQVVSFSLF